VQWKRGPTILLVEDDTELRRLIARTLRRDRYQVVECANGDAALDWLGDGVFDGYYQRLPELIVSDVRLPYFDGFELLEVVREGLTRVPVILITAFPDAELYRRAFAFGARNVLAKPFDLEELRAAVWLALRPGA
jgi:two-component system chemotaxis response regulator CheY